MTFGVLPEQVPVLKEKIREFRSEIMKFVSINEKSSDVVLLNIQLFPVTGPPKPEEGSEEDPGTKEKA
jgi:hypothetical protein